MKTICIEFASDVLAEEALKRAGFSVGTRQRGAPRGILHGNYLISKWRNADHDLRAVKADQEGGGAVTQHLLWHGFVFGVLGPALGLGHRHVTGRFNALAGGVQLGKGGDGESLA